MKTIVIGRPTIVRSGIMHILEHTMGCVVVCTCSCLREMRDLSLFPRVRLYCIEAECIELSGQGLQHLLRLSSLGTLIVYGGGEAVSRKTALNLVSLGIRDMLDVTKPVDQIRAVLKRSLGQGIFNAETASSREGSFSAERDKIISVLTPREKEVLKLVSMGETSKSIAYELNLSKHTVEFYRKRVMRKTGAASVASLTRLALRSGITFLWE